MTYYNHTLPRTEHGWFSYIKNTDRTRDSLINYLAERRSSPIGWIIVYYEKRPDSYSYTLFNNVVELSNFMLEQYWKHGGANMHFGEVIFGEVPQKIRYDIDIKDPQAFHLFDECVSEVITSTEYVLAKHGVAISRLHDIIVTTSHGDDKRSAHIIIDGYYHSNNNEAKHFNGLVMQTIPEHLKPYIDQGVYKKIQNFRMLSSSKCGTNRVKNFDTWGINDSVFTWKPSPQLVKQYPNIQDLHFAATLLTVTDHCQKLPDFGYQPPRRELINIDMNNEIMRVVYEAVQYLNRDGLVWNIESVESTKVELKRVNPAECISCKRVHDKQNASIVVSRGTFINVFFNCYQRPPGAPMVALGIVPGEDFVEDEDLKFEVGDIPQLQYEDECVYKDDTLKIFEQAQSQIIGRKRATQVITPGVVPIPASLPPVAIPVPLATFVVDYSNQTSVGCDVSVAPTVMAPAPTVMAPAPTVMAPAPTVMAPAPTVMAPAPTVMAPAPTVMAPAPTVMAPAPTVMAPAPITVEMSRPFTASFTMSEHSYPPPSVPVYDKPVRSVKRNTIKRGNHRSCITTSTGNSLTTSYMRVHTGEKILNHSL